MKDNNGIEMKTGDIVEIKNAFFKNDNGIYFVAHTPGDVSWCSSDYSLRNLCKNGNISTAKYNLAFWPLSACTSNREKNAECRTWNKEHATIEVIYNIDNSQVIEYFKNEVKINKGQADHNAMYYGEESSCTKLSRSIYNLYIEVIARMEVKEEVKTAEPEQIIEAQPEVIEAVETMEEATTEPEAEQKQPELTEEPQTAAIERKYYSINEQLARQAKAMWSFSDYSMNSTTNSYKAEVNRVYEIVEHIQEQKPHRLEESEAIAEKYSRKYAEWINKGNAIEMRCPSVMICGAGNFPVRKKEKQNRARDNHQKEYEYINGYITKLENILMGKEIIKSADDDAIERLQEKLEELEALQQTMKDSNSYYKKNNTLQGFKGLDQKEIDSIMDFMSRYTYHTRPFEGYSLTNNNAKIKSTKERLEKLKKAKAAPTKETIENDICKVVENTEAMRIQLIFDGKPDEKTREILKSNGFRWAPSQGAWQRQLTDNARYATKRAMEQLNKMQVA